MSRMFGFNQPHEKIESRFWRSNLEYNNANVGRFVRNTVLDGATYGTGDLVPSYLKTSDIVHNMCGFTDITGRTNTVYGGVKASAQLNQVINILKLENGFTTWVPGGNGTNSWFAVKMPEASLADRYMVGSLSSGAPLSWILSGSLDGEAWTSLHVVENTGVWATGNEIKTFIIPEETRGQYNWYRLSITGSNVTTMSFYTFRLLRPVSVCPRGSILLDASTTKPLTLSFCDGFNGGTPVDNIETITAPQLISLTDVSGGHADTIVPTSGGAYDIYAKRTSGGGVSLEAVAYGGVNSFEYLSGGMQNFTDRGFQSSLFADQWGGKDYMFWGRSTVPSNLSTNSTKTLRRVDNSPFFVQSFMPRYWGSPSYASFLDVDTTGNGVYTRIATAPPGQMTSPLLPLGLSVYGLSIFEQSPSYGMRIFGASTKYKHKMIQGTLLEMDINDPAQVWHQVQKIKLATVRVVAGLVDVTNVVAKATAFSTWGVGDTAQTLAEG